MNPGGAGPDVGAGPKGGAGQGLLFPDARPAKAK